MHPRAETTRSAGPQPEALIIGGGFSGVATLHTLRERGIDAQLLEAGDDVGGVWFWNRYPGARCDTEVFDYSYAFPEVETEWDWHHRLAYGPQLQEHIAFTVDRYDLRRHITFGARVTAAAFDDDTARWTVTTEDGRTFDTPHVVFATGVLSASQLPAIPGIEDFAGVIAHTGDWPADGVPVEGRRVGVIGTGSSGVQIIPELAPHAAELVVFQRTANHVVPANNSPIDEAWRAELRATALERRAASRASIAGISLELSDQSALAVDDDERQAIFERRWDLGGFNMLVAFNDLDTDEAAAATADAFVRGKIRELVTDPQTAEKLMPGDHPFGTKRVGVGIDYYETFNRDNVRLHDGRTQGIERITPSGVLLTDGEEVGLDVLICATGFDSFTGAMTRIDIRGRGGETIQEHWKDGASTYLGVGMAGFPNLFMINGPGSPSVFGNAPLSAEDAANWLADLLLHAQAEGDAVIEAEAGPEAQWTEHLVEVMQRRLLRKLKNTWYHGGNTPGKPQRFMAFTAGQKAYLEALEDARDDDYRGFMLSPSVSNASVGASAAPSPAPASGIRPGHVIGAVEFVSDLRRSLALYDGILGLDVEPAGPVDDALAAAFGLPAGEGRVVRLRSEGFEAGTITLVELPGAPPLPLGRHDLMQSGRTVPVVSSPALPAMTSALTAAGIERIADPYPSISEWGQAQEFVSFDPDGGALCMLEMRPLDGAPVKLDYASPWEHGVDHQVSPVVRMSLIVADLDRTLAFYAQLGLENLELRQFSGDVAATLGLPPCSIRMAYAGAPDSPFEPGLLTLGATEITSPPPPALPAPPTSHVCTGQIATVIAVADPAEAMARLRGEGVTFLDGGDAFFDPDLNLVTLVAAPPR